MLWMFCTFAYAGKWDGQSGDVVTTRDIAATPEQLYQALLNLDNYQDLYPEDCMSQFVPGNKMQDVGASATLRYDIATLHRKLTVTIEDGRSGVWLDYDHPGKKGFQTRFTFALLPGENGSPNGTQLTMTTALNPPPWPLTGYYFRSIQPEWESCQTRFLEALSKKLTG